jgi:hypothetical protein
MNLYKEEIELELSNIKKKIESSIPLTDEDLKIILLSKLSEEDFHEKR